jgi:TPP-dependent 2-oxoacid decarboxylase
MAQQRIARVLRSERERSLPVYIELPRDMTKRQRSPCPSCRGGRPDSDALVKCAEEIFERPTASKVGAIIVHVEIRRICQMLDLRKESRQPAWPILFLRSCGADDTEPDRTGKFRVPLPTV